MLGTLLRLHRAVRRNRLRRLGPLGRLGAVLVALGAAIGLWFVGDSWLLPHQPAGLPARVERWAFWCMTLSALVFGYTSFEVLYRDGLTRRLSIQPISPGALYALKVIQVYQRHLPLILLSALTGLPLLAAGHPLFWVQGVLTSLCALVFGLALAIFAHVFAGQSLVGGASRIKEYFVDGFGPPEAAFLFYSPAMALTAALAVGMLCDLALEQGVTRGDWGPMQNIAGGASVLAVLALLGARRIFIREHHQIAPRFADVEVLPPWREGDLPRAYLGQSIESRLAVTLRPLYRRSLLQYRRRFRIMPPLMLLSAIFLVAYGASAAQQDGAALRLATLAVVAGVLVFTPAFRLCGPELGVRFDTRGLPVNPQQEGRVHWILAASEWAVPLLASIAGGLYGGMSPLAVLGVALAVGLAFGVTNALAIPRALKAAPDILRVAFLVRGIVLLVLGATIAITRGLGLA